MENNPFQTREPCILNNQRLRTPQREAFAALVESCREDTDEREVGIVLPVGCGKSGCITLAPFAFQATRTLVVAPGVRIAQQLHRDFDPTQPDMFFLRYGVLTEQPYPEPVEIRGTTTNRADLEESDVVITNIQQLQGENNRWLENLPEDFFDLIEFDEGHHSVAATWEALKQRFPNASVINYSATPLRADGQRMAGRILYSYPVSRAITEGYVKRLTAVVLNPTSLRYVRQDNGEEVTIPLEEVRRLGEQDPAFRRSIVTSQETLNTIVDASIRQLQLRRTQTEDRRHKIIASAINYEHCGQIVQAYQSRGLQADYVHSLEDAAANERVLQRLENHELDVIVQVRKLGEGFDHPYLSVAAVFSIFQNLSPFVQFVGRIMRVIVQDDPGNALNQGVVVFHAGGNVAKRWEDFQEYSEADQEYFDQLLPMQSLDFSSSDELIVEPVLRDLDTIEVREQGRVLLEEIPLLADDEAMFAVRTLLERGYTSDEVRRAMELQSVPTTRVRERQAARATLDMRVRTAVGRILGERGLNRFGRGLDRQRLARNNFVVLKTAIDRRINASVGCSSGQRSEFTRQQLDEVNRNFDTLVDEAVMEVFDG